LVHRCPMNSKDSAVEGWASWLRTGGRAPDTIRLRTGHARKMLRDLAVEDFREVTLDQLVEFLGRQRWKPNTVRSYRASICAFYDWARKAQLIERSPTELIPTPKVPRSRPHPIPDDRYQTALSFTKYDRRLRAEVLLAGQCGVRRFEVAKVHRDDVVEDLVGHTLQVIGKGGHERWVPLPDPLAAYLLMIDGWLFPSPRIPGRPATAAAVGRWISACPRPRVHHALAATPLRHEGAAEQRRQLPRRPGAPRAREARTTAIYTLIPDEAIRTAMEGAA